jgi:hypothetical protein
MLLLESNATAEGSSGRIVTFISHGRARKSLGGSPNLIVSSFRLLERHGFIKLLKRGTRPGSMGGACGSATEFWLPHRTNGTTDFEWKTSGAPRVAGYWRVHNEKLRRLAKDLSDIEAKVFCDLMARDRLDDGHFRVAETNLPLRALAKRLRMSVGAASKAVSALVTKQVIARIGGGTGRSPARFHVDRDYAQPVPRRRKTSKDRGR